MDWNSITGKISNGFIGIAGIAGKICVACFGLACLAWLGPGGWVVAGIVAGSYILKKKKK